MGVAPNGGAYAEALQPFAYHLAGRLLRALPPWRGGSITVDDLSQEGITAILPRLSRYNPACGTTLAQFVGRRMQGAMVDLLRVEGLVDRANASLPHIRFNQKCPLEEAALRSTPEEFNRLDCEADYMRIVRRAGLTARQTEVVSLKREGYTQREIANLLAVTEGRVSRLWAEASERLRAAAAPPPAPRIPRGSG